MKDYSSASSIEKHYKLGGLGPSNIGSDEWMQAKKKKELIKKYMDSIIDFKDNNNNKQ